MKIYIVQRITGYDGWGSAQYGNIDEIFLNKENAKKYCDDMHFDYKSGWPEYCITEREVYDYE